MSGTGALDTASMTELNDRLRGPVVSPEDEWYDDTRAVYNAMIDRKPAAIAYCVNVADVMRGVDFARGHDLPLAIRGGGHHGAGFGVCDDGLVLDLSRMRGIRIDPDARTATVQAGATWGDVDHATHIFGLATPSGIISTTGVAGLTLGGGHGYLTRKYGLTVDNLRSADVVLADGQFVTASDDKNPDLFWALRGGGGNFGVVTSFEFQLHPVDTVFAGETLWPIERTQDALRWYDSFMQKASDDVYGFFQVLTIPPMDTIPRELHGRKVCGVMWCFLGEEPQAESDVMAPARRFDEPTFEHMEHMPYPALQSAFDALYPRGLQWYWKGHFLRTLEDDAIARFSEFGKKLPTAHSTSHLYPIDGAVHRKRTSDTAFAARDMRWSQVIAGVDPDPRQADRITGWTRGFWESLRPNAGDAGYLNFLMNDGNDLIRATYGENYNRLVDVKRKYDPDNMFRINQNIPPGT